MKAFYKTAAKLIFFLLFSLLTTKKSFAQKPYLGSLGSFAVLARGNLTDNNPNIIYGLVGCAGTLEGSSASSDSTILSGQELTEAIGKLEHLHDSLKNLTSNNAIELGEIEDNMVLEDGLYFITGNLTIPDNYTIHLQSNDSDAVFIFNISEKFIIGESVRFVLNGVKASNVFWNVTNEISIKSNAVVFGIFISGDITTISDNVLGKICLYTLNDLSIENTNSTYAFEYLSSSVLFSLYCPYYYSWEDDYICLEEQKVLNGRFNTPPVNGTNTNGFISLFDYNHIGNTHTSNPNGVYTIGTNANLYNSAWPNLNSYTNDGGYFMMIDGYYDGPATKTVWKQDVILTKTGVYTISAMIANLTNSNDPNELADLEFWVNGELRSWFSLPENDISWRRYCVNWGLAQGAGVTTVTIEIRQKKSQSAQGNDYAIDNISFRIYGPYADAGTDKLYCQGSSHPVSIGTPDYPNCWGRYNLDLNYYWNPTTGLDNPNIATPKASPNVTTTYTLTHWSPGGLTTDQVTVTVIPEITLGTEINPETQYIKNATPTTINTRYNVTGGTGAYNYEWLSVQGSPLSALSSVTQLNPTFTYNIPGTYTYYLQIISGVCSKIYYRTFVVVGPPTNPNFGLFTNNKTCDNPNGNDFIVASPLSSNIYSYTWDFDNGSYGSGTLVNSDFSKGGTYKIKLTITDLWGRTASTVKAYEFLPSYASYNANCCAEDDQFFTGTTNRHDGDLVIEDESNTIWNLPQFIRGTLTIKENSTLTINNGVVVSFGMKGRIIIEPGAKLVIDGATIQGIASCSTMWQGIEVWGDETYSHNGASQQDHQGKLIMKNGAVIKNAHKAVFVGKRNYCIPGYNCLTTRGVQNYEPGYGGGLVDIQGSTFSNNAIDIEFAPFVSPTGTAYTNRSIIKNNTFSGGTLLDPAYDSDNTAALSYPNTNNPYYANANTAGRTVFNIKTYKVYNLNILDNNFTNAEYGIFSIDSRLNISKGAANGNSFNNMSYGIHALYTGTTFDYAHSISNNRFNQISQAAIRADGGRYINIKQNDFGNSDIIPPSTQVDNPLGIYLDGSSNFNVSDNTFFRLGEGTRILESGAAGGKVSSENGIGNVFTQNAKGVVTSGYNFNLQIRCNHYNNNVSTDYYNRNWDIAGTLANQGSDEDHTKPAGNELRPESRKDIYSNTPFWYFAHARAVDNTFATLPTGASGSVWNESSYLQNTGFVKQVSSCIPPPPCQPNCDVALNNNAAWRLQLEEYYEEIMENLDQGHTEDILLALADPSVSSFNLKEMLLEYSPLSELTIAAMLDNSNRFTLNDFLSVLEVNMPVSSELWDEAFIPLISSLDTASAVLLKAYQLTDETGTLASLEAQYLEALNQQQQIVEEMVIHEMDIDSEAPAALLQAQAQENKEVATATYLARGETASAFNMIEEITNEYGYSDWATLSNIQYNLLQNNNTWFNIDNIQEDELRRIQEESTEVKAKLNAQAVLTLLNSETFPMREQEQNYSRIIKNPLKKKYEFKNQNSISNLLNPYPNPAGDAVYVPYNVTSDAQLIISNTFGQIVDKITLNKGYQLLKIETSTYPAGMYLFVFNSNEMGKVLTKKVLIQR